MTNELFIFRVESPQNSKRLVLIVCLKLFGLVKNERNFSSNANQQIIENDKQLKVAEIV